ERTEDGATVEVAGMVTARQRPETANGVVFMLIEDERGSVNLIVPPRVYEQHRHVVRASPLIRASGKLERREGTTNVVVAEIHDLERPAAPPAPAEAERPDRPSPVEKLLPGRGRMRGRRLRPAPSGLSKSSAEAAPPMPDMARPDRREPPAGAPSRREREL